MTKTLIVSHETTCQLLEAHAAMAAWYYQLTDALRAAGGQAEPPDEQKRKAFLEQIATNYPELAEAARSIAAPRPFIPPPVFTAPAVPPPAPAEAVTPNADPVGAAQPDPAPPPPVAPATVPDAPPLATDAQSDTPSTTSDAAADVPDDAVAPPPMVDPKKVRYD